MTEKTFWQDILKDICWSRGWKPPVWHMVSDIRGIRTAWSSYATVEGVNHYARYWYDGKNVNNAMEDAGEVAWKALHGQLSQQRQPSQQQQQLSLAQQQQLSQRYAPPHPQIQTNSPVYASYQNYRSTNQ